ncbi:MAG: hypothetical protein M1830_008271 [Pleopsidium flavum]|nr:MAG: hypothetical protein M1830_008271 [Pleopsidium flavum]
MYLVPTYNAQVTGQNGGQLTEVMITVIDLRNEVKLTKGEEEANNLAEEKAKSKKGRNYRKPKMYQSPACTTFRLLSPISTARIAVFLQPYTVAIINMRREVEEAKEKAEKEMDESKAALVVENCYEVNRKKRAGE